MIQERGLTAEGGRWDGIQSTSGGLAFDRVQEYFFYCARRESRSGYLVTEGVCLLWGGEGVAVGCFHSL